MTSHEGLGLGGARPIRLLSLIPTFWPRQGGAQMVLAAIARGLAPGVENVVLTRGYAGSPRDERYDDLDVHRYLNPAPEPWKDYATGAIPVSFPAKACVGVLDVIGSVMPLRRMAKQADIVHVHFPLPLGLSTLALPRAGSAPVVVTVHGNADIYELPAPLVPVTRAVLKRAQAIVSVSHDLADHLSSRLGVDSVTVVPNGVDTDLFRPVTLAPSDAIRLLSVSRIVPRKNIPVLIAAVNALAREGERRFKLVIAGTGPSEGDVERLARDSVGDVSFLGFVDEARKRELLGEADVFVQLSMREGLSIATLEAMATGVPCMVSDLPGVREPVEPGKTGYLVPNPESVEDVIAVLRRLLDSRAELEAMRTAARLATEERYSLDAMAQGYLRVYQRLLAARTA
jgi:glycosyltransferase involved in cell wall biosynthesis